MREVPSSLQARETDSWGRGSQEDWKKRQGGVWRLKGQMDDRQDAEDTSVLKRMKANPSLSVRRSISPESWEGGRSAALG